MNTAGLNRTYARLAIIGSALLLVAGILGVLIPAALSSFAPMQYIIRVKLADFPESDAELESWLSNQPDVSLVWIQRFDDVLVIRWVNSATRFKDPIAPDIRSHLQELGYAGASNYSETKSYLDK